MNIRKSIKKSQLYKRLKTHLNKIYKYDIILVTQATVLGRHNPENL